MSRPNCIVKPPLSLYVVERKQLIIMPTIRLGMEHVGSQHWPPTLRGPGGSNGWGPGEKVLSAYSYLSANVDSRVGNRISS